MDTPNEEGRVKDSRSAKLIQRPGFGPGSPTRRGRGGDLSPVPEKGKRGGKSPFENAAEKGKGKGKRKSPIESESAARNQRPEERSNEWWGERPRGEEPPKRGKRPKQAKVPLWADLEAARHKTRMCRYFLGGTCAKGAACNFAHSEEELQGKAPQRVEHNAARHKTRWFRFFREGNCVKGAECTFAHPEGYVRETEDAGTESGEKPYPPPARSRAARNGETRSWVPLGRAPSRPGTLQAQSSEVWLF